MDARAACERVLCLKGFPVREHYQICMRFLWSLHVNAETKLDNTEIH